MTTQLTTQADGKTPRMIKYYQNVENTPQDDDNLQKAPPSFLFSSPTSTDAEPAPEPTEPKETLNLVIPEKASSFSIHPGRLCMDQCFYCGGKFGLFDTPCHIAQIKSSERQKKVLDSMYLLYLLYVFL